MENSIPILWHGSPHRFDAFGRRAHGVRLGASWTAADPVVAAIYAGAGGLIYPVTSAPDIRILDASAPDDGDGFHYMGPGEVDLVRDAARQLGVSAGLNAPPGSAAAHFEHGRNEACWEGMLCEGIPPEDLGQLLTACGWDAVLTHDTCEGVLGDHEARILSGLRRKRLLVPEDKIREHLSSDELRVHDCARHLAE